MGRHQRVLIWVVDDVPRDAQEAASRITFASGHVHWPEADDEIEVHVAEFHTHDVEQIFGGVADPSALPGLVLLDLIDNATGSCAGDAVYRRLREIEARAGKRPAALVIVWSAWRRVAAAKAFVDEVGKGDHSFIYLDSKSHRRLEEAVRNCLRRIIDEQSIVPRAG